MCSNKPMAERATVWTYTLEEVERRWQVHLLFDPLNRFFGSGKGQDNGTATPDNSLQMLANLENVIPLSEE